MVLSQSTVRPAAMNPQSSYLRGIRQALDMWMRPELTSPLARDAGALSSDMLLAMILENESGALKQRYVSEFSGFVAEPGDVAESAAAWSSARGQIGMLAEQIAFADDGVSRHAELSKIAKAEFAYLTALRAIEQAERANAPASGEREALTPSRFESYLRRRFPGTEIPAVKEMNEFPGGGSKRTFALTLEPSAIFPENIILRQDMPFNMVGNSLVDEYALLSRLRSSGLPIAHPLLAEFADTETGGPFIIFARLPGRTVGDLWGFHVIEGRDDITRQWARLLAQVHSVDIGKMKLPGAEKDESGPERVLRQILNIKQYWDARKIVPSAPIALGLAWLMRNIENGVGGQSLVHGDPALTNILVENGRITALLDWEFAHIGDPAEDLAYIHAVVDQVMVWGDFLDLYTAAGGGEISPFRIRFFDVWRATRNAIYATVSGITVQKGLTDKMRVAHAGLYAASILEQQLLSMIIEDFAA